MKIKYNYIKLIRFKTYIFILLFKFLIRLYFYNVTLIISF